MIKNMIKDQCEGDDTPDRIENRSCWAQWLDYKKSNLHTATNIYWVNF